MVRPYQGRLKIWSIHNRRNDDTTKSIVSVWNSSGKFGFSNMGKFIQYENQFWLTLFNCSLFLNNKQEWKKVLNQIKENLTTEVKRLTGSTSTPTSTQKKKDHLYLIDSFHKTMNDDNLFVNLCSFFRTVFEEEGHSGTINMYQDLYTFLRIVKLLNQKVKNRTIIVYVGANHLTYVMVLLLKYLELTKKKFTSEEYTNNDPRVFIGVQFQTSLETSSTKLMEKYTEIMNDRS